MQKYSENCTCPLDIRVVLQRNNQPIEKEAQLEPLDDAVYNIVVTNK